nr:MAG TPA: hypothetical protein [Inoviridae sp.]
MDFDDKRCELRRYRNFSFSRRRMCCVTLGQRVAMRDKILLARVLRHYAFRKDTK